MKRQIAQSKGAVYRRGMQYSSYLSRALRNRQTPLFPGEYGNEGATL
jgi:hypothetical protein